MRTLILLSILVAAQIHAEENPRTPVIVELFTSEGCSSCPAADALLKRLSEKQEIDPALIIPLGFHVDYWDDAAWKDRFSSAAFTARQQAYARAMKLRSPYTPQMIVGGQAQFVGSDEQAARDAIDDAAKQPIAPLSITIKKSGDKAEVVVAAATISGNAGDLFLAITEDNLSSQVKGGENAGRKIPHAPVIRVFQKVDAKAIDNAMLSASATLAIDPAWKVENLQFVAFVQQADRNIIAAGVVKLK